MNRISKQIIDCFKRGNKLMIVGNGGSAAMAQHLAAEFICKFEHDREPLPAMALTTDSSILTAVSNDYSFTDVFARQIKALGKVGDILLVMSTSGKSMYCLYAGGVARNLGIEVIKFPTTGKTVAHIQEKHFKLMHDIAREVEKEFIH